MSNFPGKTEYSFEYDDRGGVSSVSGDLADARRICQVLFGKRRADDIKFGVDLPSYLMEIADDETKKAIQEAALRQIKTYCPGVNIRGVLVQYQSEAAGASGGHDQQNTLLFGISIGSRDSGAYDFGISVSRGNDGRVVATLST